jgi:hypothetical protein
VSYVLVSDENGVWNVFEVRSFWRESNNGNYIGRSLASLGRGLVTVPQYTWTRAIHPAVLQSRNPGQYEVEMKHVVKRVETLEEAEELVEQIKGLSAELVAAREKFALMLKMV